MKRKTTEEIIQKIETNGLMYLNHEYRERKNDNKSDLYVLVTCGKHEPYWIEINKTQKTKCKKCVDESKILWNEEIVCFIKDNYNNYSKHAELLRDINNKFNTVFTETALKTKVNRLGLKLKPRGMSDDDIKLFVESINYIYHEQGYKTYPNGKKVKTIRVSCGRHEPYWIPIDSFKCGSICKQCHIENITKWNCDTIVDYIKNNTDLEFIEFVGEIRGNETYVRVKCNNGHIYPVLFSSVFAGKRCKKCVSIENGEKYKYTIDKVQDIIWKNTPNINIIDGIYENQNSVLTFHCSDCDNTWELSAKVVQNNKSCLYCGFGGKFSINIEKIRETAINLGLILLDDNYIDSKEKMNFVDEFGYRYFLSYDNIRDKGEDETFIKFSIYNKYTIENIKNYLKLNNISDTLLSTNFDYAHEKMEWVCECGNKYYKSWTEFQGGYRCEVCSLKSRSGENHYLWNTSLTYEDRINKRGIMENVYWRKSVFEKCDYTCIITKQHGGVLNAHHLNGYNWDVENRFNINNGVCLSKNAHDEFHMIYGYGDNTLEQFKEFYFNKTGEEFIQKGENENES